MENKIPNASRAGDHWYDEGDCAHPIKDFYKKGFWKRNDRKRFLKNILKELSNGKAN